MHQPSPPPPPAKAALPQREFVAMMALVMALNALAIDAMLPALPAMATELGAPDANAQQLVISTYFFGLGAGALLHGPLADRFGRRRVILWSIVGYFLSALASGLAPDWTLLLVIRFVHGLFGAAMGVVSTAIVRDRTSGDEMARLLSMIFLIFMIVPIIAPTIGQGVLLLADWRWIFLLLAVMSIVMGLWIHRRLPETLAPEDVLLFKPAVMAKSWAAVATHRSATAYMLGSAIAVGANFGFLNSSQQIIAGHFGQGDIFPLAFACVAGGLAVANYSNSKLVLRFGARRVSQTALLSFILLSIVQWWLAGKGETLPVFIAIVTLNMSMVGFIAANFSAIAMEPFGHIAGTASSFQNAVRTFVAAALGVVIGQAYDGSTVPLAQGYLLCGMVALLVVLWGERGRLFTRPNPPRLPIPRA